MISNLTHLHDETKDVGVVVQHDTLAHIGIKPSSRVSHDTVGEVTFNLAEELVVQDDTTCNCQQISTEKPNKPEY